jgi:FMN reductase
MPNEPSIAIGVSGSPSSTSRSRALLECVLERLRAEGASTELVDLSVMPGDALLGRSSAAELSAAIAAVGGAHIVVASTPVYRATYTGLLKLFFDALPLRALAGKVTLPLATGSSAGHASVIDHGLRPLFASLEALVSPSGVFATDGEFRDGVPNEALVERAERAALEAWRLASGLRLRPDSGA